MRIRFSQCLGHLPAVLTWNLRQQSLQVASYSFSHLGAAKVRPDAHQQFSQGLRALPDDAQLSLFLTACLFCPFFGGHLLHLPEASYHIFVLSGTVVLGIIRERGKRGLPLEDIYRQLYNPTLYLMAYARLYSNEGAMTRGTTSETVDGMALAKITQLIDDLRHERFRWTPVR